jgi:hypothetical protein
MRLTSNREHVVRLSNVFAKGQKRTFLSAKYLRQY